MLAYPDVNHPFILYTDLSDIQLGGLLVQVDPNTKEEDYLRKLNPTQLIHSVMENELLSISESLKHFHNIIYGAEILLQTDQKNICHDEAKHTSKWVLCPRILISQEYGAKIEYYEGKKNTRSDDLSRLPRSNEALKAHKLKFMNWNQS